MRLKTVLIGAFALVFGLSAAIGVYLLGSRTQPSPKLEMVSVLVAAVDINRGQTLAAADVLKRDWPKDLVPEGAITNLDEALDRAVAIPLTKGDLLVEQKLASKGSGRGMASIIPPGMRAVTIQTPNVATGVAGFVLPGSNVDVLLTMTNMGAADRTGGGSTITLLQNVEVVAVDQRTDAPQDNKVDSRDLRSVTLLVTPAQAAKLDLGTNKGTLRLTLRNPTDKNTSTVDPITLTELGLSSFEGVHVQKVVTPEPEPIPVQVTPPLAPPPLRQKVIPQIRTLKGTKAGIIRLPDSNNDTTDEPGQRLRSSSDT